MTGAVTRRVRAYTDPELAIRDAWVEYLEACRSCHPFAYEEVEAWSWSRLARELKRIERLRG